MKGDSSGQKEEWRQLQDCERCSRLFRVILTEGHRGWQQAHCPYCRAIHYFDTRFLPGKESFFSAKSLQQLSPAKQAAPISSKTAGRAPLPNKASRQQKIPSPSLIAGEPLFRSRQNSNPTEQERPYQTADPSTAPPTLKSNWSAAPMEQKLEQLRRQDDEERQLETLQLPPDPTASHPDRETVKRETPRLNGPRFLPERAASGFIARIRGARSKRAAIGKEARVGRGARIGKIARIGRGARIGKIAGIRERKIAEGRIREEGKKRWRQLFQVRYIAPALLFSGVVGGLSLLLTIFSLDWQELYLLQAPEFYLKRLNAVEPNRIVDRDGQLLAELFSQKTGNLKPEQIPQSLQEKLIFVEDGHFFHHNGIHWPSIFRAALRNLLALQYSQGGSTITQQLARILLLERQKAILRKLREASLAIHLEEKLSKKEILAAYINLVYLGHGAIGFQNAARFYFDKELKELTFFEELALASLPSGPERFSPLRHPKRLQQKMRALYQRMKREEPKLLGGGREKNYEKEVAALFRHLNKSPAENVFGNRVNYAPYVTEHIRLKLSELLGTELQYGAGLAIKTSISGKLQEASAKETKKFIEENAPLFPPTRPQKGEAIEEELKKELEEKLEEKISDFYSSSSLAAGLFGLPTVLKRDVRLQVAVVGIENHSGNVVFLQGGAGFTADNQLNRVTKMHRQTGSAIKPIVYSAALEDGAITTATLLDDRPIFEALDRQEEQEEQQKQGKQEREGKQEGQEKQKKTLDYWAPGNFDDVFEGFIPAREAFVRSKNIPAIRVAKAIGLNRLGQQFSRFFFSDKTAFQKRFRKDESIAIGSLEMSPLEMALAYSAFASDGIIHRPKMILSIESLSKEQLYLAEEQDEFKLGIPQEKRVLPADVAEIMVSLLQDSARYGGVRRGGYYGKNFFGKTGTSNAYRDSWFIGGTPEVTTAVWVGYDKGGYSMNHGTGARLAGALWGRIMRHLPKAKGEFTFSKRALAIDICSDTGQKLGPNCRAASKQELFRPQFPPDEPPKQQLAKENLPMENLPVNWSAASKKTTDKTTANRVTTDKTTVDRVTRDKTVTDRSKAERNNRVVPARQPESNRSLSNPSVRDRSRREHRDRVLPSDQEDGAGRREETAKREGTAEEDIEDIENEDIEDIEDTENTKEDRWRPNRRLDFN